MILSLGRSSRQPKDRLRWRLNQFVHERNIVLGNALDRTTYASYSSHLNSWIAFCNTHEFPIEPTIDTLSFFVVYMSKHIDPRSVGKYLSGICHELEPYYPDVWQMHKHMLVSRTLKGCIQRFSKPIERKEPATVDHIDLAIESLGDNPSHDEILFVTMLMTGFKGLLRLGEMVANDNPRLRDYSKYSLRDDVQWLVNGFSFWLKSHKTDRAFEGAWIVITDHERIHTPYFFVLYLKSRDKMWPFNPFLWLTSSGEVPTRQWFIRRLCALIPDGNFAGQSLRSGGATRLAEEGTPNHLTQAIGRWTSETFQIYIRRHPVLLEAIMNQTAREHAQQALAP